MRARRGFTMVELAMIMVIISLLSAIAVPRITHAAASAQANALVATIDAVRESMELYYAEHGLYPGHHPTSGFPDSTWFMRQMLEYSNERGNTQAALGYPFIYGPYLRDPFPTNPLNGLSTVRVIANKGTSVALGSSGWIAILSTGEFFMNTSEAELADIGISDDDTLGKMVIR